MKVLTVVGARPQFVKASVVSSAIERDPLLFETLIHTGQHYDPSLSDRFFRDLGLPGPAYQLAVGSAPHGAQTGLMMQRIEPVVEFEQPACVVVYGDTNSTVAAAMVAAKMGIPVAHVEAGLRSFDRAMPEEINRVVTDHLSTHLYCPSGAAAQHLANEGIDCGVHIVGDVMLDVLRREFPIDPFDMPDATRSRPAANEELVVVTIHRPANTDDPEALTSIVSGLSTVAASGRRVVWPVHPRTRAALSTLSVPSAVSLIDPLGYREMLELVARAGTLVTDSGGLQKEAYWLGTPCVTVRPSTEWTETVDEGWNRLVTPEAIALAVASAGPGRTADRLAYGAGGAAGRIVHLLRDLCGI